MYYIYIECEILERNQLNKYLKEICFLNTSFLKVLFHLFDPIPPHITGKSCTRPPTEDDLGEISLEIWQVSSGFVRLIISVLLSCVPSIAPVATMRRSEMVNAKICTLLYFQQYLSFI